ncbi:acyltransferase family protein [Sphingobium sp. B11D3D]|uniref:acyltransferase family protein n=1 Tax=Sphingobium sp. B11D3D TaxID=2940576 RepID=UPI0022253ABF|nr:acyltransferase [Sphingobium sp. B11D3D]MCW2369205.1 exopolysaccharide production protein ExoZ [Sphingobium sp. B11D3D]
MGTFKSIQMLRALAATAVVFFHAHQDAEAEGWLRAFRAEDRIFAFGEAGVHIFFVISGFVMMISFLGPRKFSFRDFLMKRFIRIYPVYWLVLAISLLIFFAIGRQIHSTGLEFFGVMALWPGLSPRYISPAWTLSYEVYFYLCFATAMLLGRQRGFLILCGFFILMIASRPFLDTGNAFIDLATNGLLIEFLTGAAIALWLTYRKPSLEFGRTLVIGAILVFLAGFALEENALPKVVLWGIPSCILIAGVVAWESNSGASNIVNALARFGDSSYILYLTHKPIQWGLLALLLLACPGSEISALAWVVPISSLCLVLGEAAFLYVEKPLMKRLKLLTKIDTRPESSGTVRI